MSATATAVKFHAALHVADPGRSADFYCLLFGVAPAKQHADYVKFELDEPPLVLALVPNPRLPGGTLNHLGLRLADAAALVEVQRRLEEAGIATQRQEGVECCYARQTKFWVTDPDHNLWEVYTVEADLTHSGFDDPPSAVPAAPAAVWEHRLTDPLPDRIPQPDGSLDEVRLEGTFNATVEAGQLAAFLGEVRRVLRPGGRVVVHGLVGDGPFLGVPALPGLASLVQRVPVQTEVPDALRGAGFVGAFFEKLGDVHCFRVNGVELREMRLVAWRPFGEESSQTHHVLYKGPFARATDEDGVAYRRGERAAVTAAAWQRLRAGPAAGQFLFFPPGA